MGLELFAASVRKRRFFAFSRSLSRRHVIRTALIISYNTPREMSSVFLLHYCFLHIFCKNFKLPPLPHSRKSIYTRISSGRRTENTSDFRKALFSQALRQHSANRVESSYEIGKSPALSAGYSFHTGAIKYLPLRLGIPRTCGAKLQKICEIGAF